MYLISFRLLLVSFFSIILIVGWMFPILLIHLGGNRSILRGLHLLTNLTSESAAVALVRQLQVTAQNGIAIRNWTRINGLPFDNPINHRTYVRKSFGQFLIRHGWSQTHNYRRFQDGSAQAVVRVQEGYTNYQFCRSNGVYNSSLTFAQQPSEVLSNCTVSSLNRETGAVEPTDYAGLSSPRSYAYGSLWESLTHLSTVDPIYKQEYYLYDPIYVPYLKEQLLITILLAGVNISYPGALDSGTPSQLLTIQNEALPSKVFGEQVLRHLLPPESHRARAFLVDPKNRVVAASHGEIFQVVSNYSSASEFFNPSLCFPESGGTAACFYNVSTHFEYTLLRLAFLEDQRRSSQQDVPRSLSFAVSESNYEDGDVFLCSKITVPFSRPTVTFELYVFIPQAFWLDKLLVATENGVIISCVVLVIGVVSIFFGLKMALATVEDLANLLSKNPMDPKLVETYDDENEDDQNENSEDEEGLHGRKFSRKNENYNNNNDSSSSSSSSSSKTTRRRSRTNKTSSSKAFSSSSSSSSSSTQKRKMKFSSKLALLMNCVRFEEIYILEVAYFEMRSIIEKLRSFLPEREKQNASQSAMLFESRASSNSSQDKNSNNHEESSSSSSSSSRNTNLARNEKNKVHQRQQGDHSVNNDESNDEKTSILNNKKRSSSSTSKKKSVQFSGLDKNNNREKEESTEDSENTDNNNSSSNNIGFGKKVNFKNTISPNSSNQQEAKFLFDSIAAGAAASTTKNSSSLVPVQSSSVGSSYGGATTTTTMTTTSSSSSFSPSTTSTTTTPASKQTQQHHTRQQNLNELDLENDIMNNRNHDLSEKHNSESNNNNTLYDPEREEKEMKQHIQNLMMRHPSSSSNSGGGDPSLMMMNYHDNGSSDNDNNNLPHEFPRFLVAAVRIPILSKFVNFRNNNSKRKSSEEEENQNDSNIFFEQKRYNEKLVKATEKIVDIMYKKVLLPTGASLIEYRNDFFLIALRLSKRSVFSKLARRFVAHLEEASNEILSLTTMTITSSKEEEGKCSNNTKNVPIVLTAGLAVGDARVLRMDNYADSCKTNVIFNNTTSVNNGLLLRPLTVFSEIVSEAFAAEKIVRESCCRKSINEIYSNNTHGQNDDDDDESKATTTTNQKLHLPHAIAYHADLLTHRTFDVLSYYLPMKTASTTKNNNTNNSSKPRVDDDDDDDSNNKKSIDEPFGGDTPPPVETNNNNTNEQKSGGKITQSSTPSSYAWMLRNVNSSGFQNVEEEDDDGFGDCDDDERASDRSSSSSFLSEEENDERIPILARTVSSKISSSSCVAFAREHNHNRNLNPSSNSSASVSLMMAMVMNSGSGILADENLAVHFLKKFRGGGGGSRSSSKKKN